ncbi:hypothetical protein M422DRAFT_255343 [Sphaerobolus stellatus SS14]|uniref:Uncharacterized protein n=1 Tax=Sphaerobolus stellatus (strain SS14) TaxID=990650 RepID=A0A0C9VU49_SPHS4|nr:hypothetical protein M422DRAFT_255343 [Sphaerobolus stellatus SS14]
MKQSCNPARTGRPGKHSEFQHLLGQGRVPGQGAQIEDRGDRASAPQATEPNTSTTSENVALTFNQGHGQLGISVLPAVPNLQESAALIEQDCTSLQRPPPTLSQMTGGQPIAKGQNINNRAGSTQHEGPGFMQYTTSPEQTPNVCTPTGGVPQNTFPSPIRIPASLRVPPKQHPPSGSSSCIINGSPDCHIPSHQPHLQQTWQTEHGISQTTVSHQNPPVPTPYIASTTSQHNQYLPVHGPHFSAPRAFEPSGMSLPLPPCVFDAVNAALQSLRTGLEAAHVDICKHYQDIKISMGSACIQEVGDLYYQWMAERDHLCQKISALEAQRPHNIKKLEEENVYLGQIIHQLQQHNVSLMDNKKGWETQKCQLLSESMVSADREQVESEQNGHAATAILKVSPSFSKVMKDSFRANMCAYAEAKVIAMDSRSTQAQIKVSEFEAQLNRLLTRFTKEIHSIARQYDTDEEIDQLKDESVPSPILALHSLAETPSCEPSQSEGQVGHVVTVELETCETAEVPYHEEFRAQSSMSPRRSGSVPILPDELSYLEQILDAPSARPLSVSINSRRSISVTQTGISEELNEEQQVKSIMSPTSKWLASISEQDLDSPSHKKARSSTESTMNSASSHKPLLDGYMPDVTEPAFVEEPITKELGSKDLVQANSHFGIRHIPVVFEDEPTNSTLFCRLCLIIQNDGDISMELHDASKLQHFVSNCDASVLINHVLSMHPEAAETLGSMSTEQLAEIHASLLEDQ